MVLHGVLCGLMLQGHTAGLFCPYAAGLRFLSAEHGETKILTQGLRLMIKYLECLLRGQNSSSWVPCCPKAGVERESASESVWILKSAVNSVCLRPQDPGRGGDWKCLKFQRGCGTVWGAIPLVEFLAFAFVLPSLFLPSSPTWDLILHEVGICVGFSAMDFSTDAHPSLNGLYWQQGAGTGSTNTRYSISRSDLETVPSQTTLASKSARRTSAHFLLLMSHLRLPGPSGTGILWWTTPAGRWLSWLWSLFL